MVGDKLLERGVFLRRGLVNRQPLHASGRLGVGIAGMRPVGEGVVEADLQPLGAERLDVFAHGILPIRRVRDLVVREVAVEHAEAIMVARREDGVLHARALREPRPFARIVVRRIEHLDKRFVFARLPRVVRIRPLAAPRDRVDAPVDEHPETRLIEPCSAILGIRGQSKRRRENCSAERSHPVISLLFPCLTPLPFQRQMPAAWQIPVPCAMRGILPASLRFYCP